MSPWRSSSESLGALSATGELRNAQQPPASSGHRDPRVPSCRLPTPLRTALTPARGSAPQRRRSARRMLRGRCQVALRRARSALGARSHVPTRAHRGRRGSRASGTWRGTRAGQSLGEGDGSRSGLSEITRLAGPLRCRCAGWGQLGTSWFPRRTEPQVAPSVKDRRSICLRFLLSSLQLP